MAKEKVQKTNAMRLLDSAGIDYSMASYDYDENDCDQSAVGGCTAPVFRKKIIKHIPSPINSYRIIVNDFSKLRKCF